MQFTVITTCYNDEKHIEQFLDCFANQTIIPTKLIVADGGSKDNTIKIINKFKLENELNIELIVGKRLNIAQGYNEAIKAANTEVIIIAGVGNLYNKMFCEELMSFMEGKKCCDVCYGKIVGINQNFFSSVYNKAFLNGKFGCDISMPSNRGVILKKGIFDINGLFNENLIYAGEDTEFFRRIIRNNVRIKYNPKAIIYWETPKTYKEFFKQQCNYQLGDFQIGISIFKRVIKSLLIIILSLALMMLIVFKNYFAIFVPIFIVLLTIKAKSLDPFVLGIKFLYNILPVFCLLKNKKNMISNNIVCK